MKIILGGKEFEVADELVTKSIEEKTNITIEGDHVLRTKDEDQKFMSNIKKEHEKVGLEIAVKEAKKSLNLEFDGKSLTDLISKSSEKAVTEAKIAPDKKVDDLTRDIGILKGTNATLLSDNNTLKLDHSNFKQGIKLDGSFNGLMPENVSIPKSDMLTILKSNISTKVDENGIVVTLDASGHTQKDPITLDPLSLKHSVDKFFIENQGYLKGGAGSGSAGGDSGSGGDKMPLSKFIQEQRDKGVEINGSEFNAALAEANKAELIDLNK